MKGGLNARRDFLKTSVGSAMVAGLAAAAEGQQSTGLEWRNRQTAMQYRQLGRSRCMVSAMVMGGNEITPDNFEHVLRAVDAGLNYLDTSPAYGNGKSELGYAKVLKARRRDQVFLTSKVSVWDNNRNEKFKTIFASLSDAEQQRLRAAANDAIQQRGTANPNYLGNYFGSQKAELEAAVLSNVVSKKYGDRVDRRRNYRQTVIESVEGTLRRLGTDHLDTLMCPHGASTREELLEHPEIFDAFDELKRAGKVRFLGVSSHSDPAGVLDACIESQQYDVAMVAYNIVNHSFVADAITRAKAAGIGVIAMKVARAVFPGPNRGPGNAQGIEALRRDAGDPGLTLPQQAYSWALRNQDLSAVISNMVNAEQVAENLRLVTS